MPSTSYAKFLKISIIFTLFGYLFFFLILFHPYHNFSLIFESMFAFPIYIYKIQNNSSHQLIKPAKTYTIVLAGDSMTAALGPNSDRLRDYFSVYYPTKEIKIFNLAKGATNIFSLKTDILPTIKDWDIDLFLIESFGHNPLSQFPLEQGLKEQSQILNDTTTQFRKDHPKGIIIFMTTIPPNREKYAQNIVSLTQEQREGWFKERVAYINNHIGYARTHNIPLINIYENSQEGTMGGKLEYIDSHDFIHPSIQGVDLISEEITTFIFKNRILPI